MVALQDVLHINDTNAAQTKAKALPRFQRFHVPRLAIALIISDSPVEKDRLLGDYTELAPDPGYVKGLHGRDIKIF